MVVTALVSHCNGSLKVAQSVLQVVSKSFDISVILLVFQCVMEPYVARAEMELVHQSPTAVLRSLAVEKVYPGIVEGIAVGLADGLPLGLLDGMALGLADGLPLGLADGMTLGLADGLLLMGAAEVATGDSVGDVEVVAPFFPLGTCGAFVALRLGTVGALVLLPSGAVGVLVLGTFVRLRLRKVLEISPETTPSSNAKEAKATKNATIMFLIILNIVNWPWTSLVRTEM